MTEPQGAKKVKKVKESSDFTFQAKGKHWTIPSVDPAKLNGVDGLTLSQAIKGDSDAETRLVILCLEGSGIKNEALAALYSLPAYEMIEICGKWFYSKQKELGVSLGESVS